MFVLKTGWFLLFRKYIFRELGTRAAICLFCVSVYWGPRTSSSRIGGFISNSSHEGGYT